jgi:hypothetical protein
MRTALFGLAALVGIALVPAATANAAAKYRHHVHHAHHYAQPRVYAAPYGDYDSGVNAGNRPDSLLSFYRRNHICAIDEGYGRVTRCD